MKKRIAAGGVFVLFAAGAALAAEGSWTGYISETLCGLKGTTESHTDCAVKCVKEHGAKYVLVNDADKKIYIIDAQDKVAAHAGHHVTVKGTVEGENLKLSSIEMAPKGK